MYMVTFLHKESIQRRLHSKIRCKQGSAMQDRAVAKVILMRFTSSPYQKAASATELFS